MACVPSPNVPMLGCCTGPPGCIRIRQFIAQRYAWYHTFCEVPCARGDTHRFFLTANGPAGYPDNCVGKTINRFTYEPFVVGGSQPCGLGFPSELVYLLDEIFPADVFTDLATIYNTPFPPPPALTYGDGRLVASWEIEPTMNASGGVVVPVDVPSGVFDQNTTLNVECPVSFYFGSDGWALLDNEDDHTWGVDHAGGSFPTLVKAKAQVYHDGPPFSACLYEKDFSGGPTSPKLNCRRITVATGWTEIPAPGFRLTTYFDPLCTCEQ